MTLLTQPLSGFHRVTNAFQGIVGVYQKNAVVRHGLGVSQKRLAFVIKRHHPAMGMSPTNRNTIKLSRQYIRSSGTSANVCRPAGTERAVHPLCPAQSKFHYRFTPG